MAPEPGSSLFGQLLLTSNDQLASIGFLHAACGLKYRSETPTPVPSPVILDPKAVSLAHDVLAANDGHQRARHGRDEFLSRSFRKRQCLRLTDGERPAWLDDVSPE
jgi:hypothetical protein